MRDAAEMISARRQILWIHHEARPQLGALGKGTKCVGKLTILLSKCKRARFVIEKHFERSARRQPRADEVNLPLVAIRKAMRHAPSSHVL